MKSSVVQQLALLILIALFGAQLLSTRSSPDAHIFVQWMRALDARGITAGYEATQADYPPLSAVLMWSVARVAQYFGLGLLAALKLSLGVFLAFTCVVFFAWTRDLLLTAVLELALIPSVLLGYVDVYFAPSLLLALWALHRRRLSLFAMFFTVTCLIKFQPLIVAPFLFLYVLDDRGSGGPAKLGLTRSVWWAAASATGVVASTLAIFGLVPVKALLQALGEQKDFVSNSLNLPWIITQRLLALYPATFGDLFHADSGRIVNTYLPGSGLLRLGFFGVFGVLLMSFARREKNMEMVVGYSLAGYLAYCMLNIGVHENHLFLAMVLAAALFWLNRRHRSSFVVWLAAANINLLVFYSREGAGWLFWGHRMPDLTVPLSATMLVLFLLFLVDLRSLSSPDGR